MYKIIENAYVGEDMYQMKVQGEFKGEMGQFYMLRAWDMYPTLSRPISIHDIDENSITFLYKVVGEGTKIFSRLTPGDNIKLEGPYGSGYQKVEGKVALVGGGIGVAPLYLVAKNIPNSDAYLGFRNEPILIDKYEEVCDNVKTALAVYCRRQGDDCLRDRQYPPGRPVQLQELPRLGLLQSGILLFRGRSEPHPGGVRRRGHVHAAGPPDPPQGSLHP